MGYEGRTANDVWMKIVKDLRDETEIQSSRIGDTKELLHVMLKITDPRQRWVLSRQPVINPAFALAEVIWILNGREDAEFLNYWNRQLPKYSGESDCYHGAYGRRLRSKFGFDQLERAYSALLNNPDSRQVNLQIWDPRTDFPDHNGRAVADDIPCNVNALLKVRKGHLEWMQVVRSNDVMLGLPYNIIQFTTLQEVMAGWLGLEVGSYNQLSDSLHIYVKDISRFSESDSIEPHQNTDRLNLPKDVSDRAFSELERVLDSIVRSRYSEAQLSATIDSANLPKPYQNMLHIIAAEEARRNKWHHLQHRLISEISNPALIQIWNEWETRRLKLPISMVSA